MSAVPSTDLWIAEAVGAVAVCGILGARLVRGPSFSKWRTGVALSSVLVVLGALLVGVEGASWSSLAVLFGVGGVVAVGLLALRLELSGRARAITGPIESASEEQEVRSRALFGTGALLALVLLADGLLGAWFVAAGSAPSVAEFGGTAGPFLSAITSSGFLIAAAFELGVVAVLAHRERPVRVRLLLAGSAVIVLLSPTTFPSASWATTSAYLGVATFVVLFVVALQFIYRTKQLTPSLSRLLVGWAFAAAVSGAGWFFWHLYGTVLALALSVVVQAVVVLYAGFAPASATTEQRLPWLLHPFWVFEILLFTFLAEFFLGALLDLVIAGPAFLGFIPFLPYPGTAAGAVGAAVYNGLWFASAVLASAWFLIVMGFTMAMLVVFKIRETREKPLRYRLGLMIAVYAVAVIYIPSLASSTPIAPTSSLGSLPVIGWGFGLRSGGPFESTAFFAILLMFAFVAVLTFLFGRKALCSVMCGAAMLYQGTAVSEMRGFNQTSRVGRYFLGSQLSTAYVVAATLALVSLFATSFLGLLHLLPSVTLANGEVDTSALPLPVELYFGGLWFAMFVTVPYLGTYNCATTGFCHWGALSLPFARFGMFRLKVKDRKVCQECTTFDCAKACPVGLVDMPLYFRTKGEYRSSKCCGVGDCVGACPYGNMYHQDVRAWFRRRLRHPSAPPVSARLPMLPTTASASSAEPAVAGRAETL